MRVSNLILFGFLFIFCPQLFGAGVDTATLRGEVLSALNELEKNGISKIDGQDIKSILEKVQTIDIRTVPYLMTPANSFGSYRASGHWNKMENTVVLAQNHMHQMNIGNRPYILLHEMAGPLDINDGNFNKSAASSLFNDLKKEEAKDPAAFRDSPALKSLKRNIERKSGGGSTGVDGGGDARLLSYMSFLQTEMIFDLLEKRIDEKTYEAASNWVATVKIEFSLSQPQGEVLYSKKLHSLLVPNNAMADPHYKINAPRARALLRDLYGYLKR